MWGITFFLVPVLRTCGSGSISKFSEFKTNVNMLLPTRPRLRLRRTLPEFFPTKSKKIDKADEWHLFWLSLLDRSDL
jgi:hypothetical protein